MDLSDLGLSPSEERTETVEQFHAHATSVFGNPFTTPTLPIEPRMLNTPPPTQQTLPQAENLYPAAVNGKGTDRCYPPKNFNQDKSKYKVWIRMVEAFIRVNRQMFTTTKI